MFKVCVTLDIREEKKINIVGDYKWQNAHTREACNSNGVNRLEILWSVLKTNILEGVTKTPYSSCGIILRQLSFTTHSL